jgi:quinohemoprotein ethanol dehydrogenase
MPLPPPGRLIFMLAVMSGLACADSLAARAESAQPPDFDSARNWASYGRTYDETFYSPLSEINETTVTRLGLAWYADLPSLGRAGAPLAVNGVLYFPTGYSEIHAFDAVTGRELWRYQPDPAVTAVPGDTVKPGWGLRGIGYWDGKIYAGTQDGRLFAVEAASGKLVWSVQTTIPGDHIYVTGAPRLYDGKVIIGNAGTDYSAVRGYVTAYDAGTGKQIWRFFVVPGDPAKGFENEAMKMAAQTWTGDLWKLGGGGSPWNAITYDPELHRVYIGTGNGGPWNRKIRSPQGGDNLFTCSIVALDSETGKYIWHYQTTPGDAWDYDSTNDITLATLPVGGVKRRVILHANKNGFFYVIDRDSGKPLSAEPYAKVTWASKIDLVTGRPVEIPGSRYPNGSALVWPGGGAHAWEPMSYSPKTALVYIPTINAPSQYEDKGIDITHWSYKPRTNFDPGTSIPTPLGAGPIPALGSLQAWDPVKQRRVWSVTQQAAQNGGVLSTGGNLVFQGDATGAFIARAADTGRKLWEFDVQDGALIHPITYSVGTRQYVTLVTYWGGTAAMMGRVSAQFGWDFRTRQRRVLTFVLDGERSLPPKAAAQPPQAWPEDSHFVVNSAKARAGFDMFHRKCFSCHGVGAVAGGEAPDLRHSAIPLSNDAFTQVVRNGALESKGMPKFDELTAQDAQDIQHYIRQEARKASHP